MLCPIDGYREPLCILTRAAADALHRAQLAARTRGLSLKVYDCYRPQRAVDDFVHWAQRPDDQKTKAEFYPGVDKSALFDDGYIAGPTSHSRGLSVDLTLVALPARAQRPYVSGEPLASCSAPQAQRFGDNTVDMGTGFDCFDSLAHTFDARITGQARTNRLLIKQFMEDAGYRKLRGRVVALHASRRAEHRHLLRLSRGARRPHGRLTRRARRPRGLSRRRPA